MKTFFDNSETESDFNRLYFEQEKMQQNPARRCYLFEGKKDETEPRVFALTRQKSH